MLCSAVAFWSHLFIHLTLGKHLLFEDGVNEEWKPGQGQRAGSVSLKGGSVKDVSFGFADSLQGRAVFWDGLIYF